ncbi:MAG: STAS domain-containing protein [Acidimicrobiaceae bacterium]|nr:STAS domain-containing protein [Acidimicrobiaceae bacterium]
MIELQTCRDSVICRPSGNLDWESARSLRHVVGDLVRPGLNLVLDMSHVAFMDAVGVSAVVGSARRVLAAGGTIRISHASQRVLWLLHLVGVDRLVEQSSSHLRPGAA